VLTLFKSIDDEGEVDEGHKHDVKLVKTGEDPPEAFESPKQSLDFVAPLVHFLVVFPWGDAVLPGWHNGRKSQIQDQLPRFIPLVRPIHYHVHFRLYRFERA